MKVIDWEKPNYSKYDSEKGEYKVVSSWRFINFMNEFRESMVELSLSPGV